MESGIVSLRSEERFMILSEDVPDFIGAIKKILRQRVFSEKCVARTIYFNNDDYPVPWGSAIKARTYLSNFSRQISLNPDEIYRLDVKSSQQGCLKSKVQKELSLADAVQFISSNLGLNLRPYAVDEYLRTHFICPEYPDFFRLTIDQGTQYGFFEDASAEFATSLGGENFARVELKLAPGCDDLPEYRKVAEIILNEKLMPVISKREYAFSLVGLVMSKKGIHPPKKETTDCEIEAKFLVRHPDPAALLLDLKRYLKRGLTDYEVAAHYPYTQEGASINHYWSRKGQNGWAEEGLKLMFIGRKVNPVLKQETRILPDFYGLNCILERKEVKGQSFEYLPLDFNSSLDYFERIRGKLDYLGYLSRSRRAFWPENKKTKRIHHISLDKCESRGGQFVEWQMEIEHIGRYAEYVENGVNIQETKTAIAEEVAELSNIVLSFCNKEKQCLFPSTLTKFGWLKRFS